MNDNQMKLNRIKEKLKKAEKNGTRQQIQSLMNSIKELKKGV